MKVRPTLLVQFTGLGLAMTVLIAIGFGVLLSNKMIADALDQTALDSAEAVTSFLSARVGRDDFGPPTPSRSCADALAGSLTHASSRRFSP